MVQIREDDGRQVWVMPRDEAVFGWLRIVRVADVQALRWVLGALNAATGPVSTRRAQTWVARMESARLVERAQLGGRGGALVWGAHALTGQAKPNLYRQTTRHEVAVATASARYATAGYAWRRDEKPSHVGGHQADGVALASAWTELVEVELTGKRLPRYAQIFAAFRRRLNAGDAEQITYLCTDEAARTVGAALRGLPAGRDIAPQVEIHSVFDPFGQWAGEVLPDWMLSAQERADHPQPRLRPRRGDSTLF